MSDKAKSEIKKSKRIASKYTKQAAKIIQPKQPETVDNLELALLVSLRSPDPHRILGAHSTSKGIVIRAFRPEAEKVDVIVGRKRGQSLEKIHPAGLFEVVLPRLTSIPEYRLQVHESGRASSFRDPYSFLPTLGDLDLHLFAEGRHEAIYEKLGSHVHNAGKDLGVSFAVWAPHAEGVSVVGSFNNWRAAPHQMRKLAGSGIWELFIPDLAPGSLYKYEIRAPGYPPFLKSDPYAFYMEVPPNTSSIVYQPTYKFRDQKWLKQREGREHYKLPLSIYELHFGSWRRFLEEDNRPFQYREMAPVLA